MPQAINELDVDYEAQIQEIRRLISTTSDVDRRASLEEQLRELEATSVEVEQQNGDHVAFPREYNDQRRRSFRPTSAKPRMMLTSLTEDREVNLTSTSFHHLDTYRQENGPSLVADVFSSSFDEQFAPLSVLINDHCTFWMSSGMYPQFLTLVLRERMPISTVEVTCRHIKRLQIQSSRSKKQSMMLMRGGDGMVVVDVPASDADKLSTHRVALTDANASDTEAIELVIESGYSEFACVYFVRLRLADPPSTDEEDAKT
uniref:Uncharacterized protein n=1 Tax=Globisporangium ultimum (strain ATCC 200006 / CBS 805.95 / DAOM BR144) TaxID=431595 RepID=K3WPH6_GLOUD